MSRSDSEAAAAAALAAATAGQRCAGGHTADEGEAVRALGAGPSGLANGQAETSSEFVHFYCFHVCSCVTHSSSVHVEQVMPL